MATNDLQHDGNEVAAEYLTYVQRLADEFRIPVEEVLPLYEEELVSLRVTARVTSYLSVLTTKHVRDALQEEKRRHKQ